MTTPRLSKFYETTLRGGEQTPGVNYFPQENLQIALALEAAGFDTLDCGFPVSSPGEFEAVRLIASKVEHSEVYTIRRAVKANIDTTWEAVKIAAKPTLQPFIGVSLLHWEVNPGKTCGQVLEMARTTMAHARVSTETAN